jgi:hypothetical protein
MGGISGTPMRGPSLFVGKISALDVQAFCRVRENVLLHKGWFDKSVQVFAAQYRDNMAFMHMDTDLCSSTKTVFDLLGSRIVPGTVIIFDEYLNYPGWQSGEFKAFQEEVFT